MAKMITIGLPIDTAKKEDRDIFRKLEKLKVARGFRARTDLLRILIIEEAERKKIK